MSLFCCRFSGVLHVLLYTLKHFLVEPVTDDTDNARVYSIPEEVDYETVCLVQKIVQYFADQRVNINKVIAKCDICSVSNNCYAHLYCEREIMCNTDKKKEENLRFRSVFLYNYYLLTNKVYRYLYI